MPTTVRQTLLCFLCWAWASAVANTVFDDRQQAVQVAAAPQRIVSLLPSLTETVCVLGRCDRLVGVDRFSNWPASVRSVPVVGGGLDPSIERIVALKPDLVLAAGSTRGADRLEALGLNVLRLEPRNHADAQRVFNVVGQALHLPAGDVQRAWQRIEAELTTEVDRLSPAARSMRVYVEVSPTPHGASESSFIGETLQRMGVGNILPGRLGPFPQVNPEFVVLAQPDAMLVGDSSREGLLKRPGWSRLPAVQQQRLCVLTQSESDMLVRAGPRMAEGVRLLVACLNRASATQAARP
jgi:iron complex transport system substrate-binding protein